MAGGGVRGGRSTAAPPPTAATPPSDPVSPDDLAATMFHCLGIDPHTLMYDLERRPIPLSYGEVIRPILG